ncbi:YsnF/AvaK domain-containing protein [Pseudomonas sp. RIT-PI-S]|uniref:YsnF/AvaK domain-containing protein n=1 Tax=Pseudomonas sp. RIT-PI-S TaxID=3035295 RepID=UPI0021DA4EC8|nr:YsnF/AvaK domain-containing protein [Pseudomonas sp. RIT-PI-S]
MNDDMYTDGDVIPVIEEEMTVSKRTVTTDAVTLEKTVETQNVTVSEVLQSRGASILRVPRDTVVDAGNPPKVRTENGVTIIPVLEEVLVVEKRLVLKEELHIRHEVSEALYSEEVTLRKEAVVLMRGDDGVATEEE